MKKMACFVGTALALTGLLSTTAACSHMEYYEDAHLYASGNAIYQASLVKTVEIDWVNGSVEIVQTSGENLTVTEKTPASAEEKKMFWRLDGDTLRIQYCKSGYVGTIDEKYKDLRVEIPVGVNLEIESVGADIYSRDLTLGEVDIDVITASVNGDSWTASDLDVESVSGNIKIAQLSCGNVDLETTNGHIATAFGVSTNMEVQTVSGNVQLALLDGVGAKVAFETVSGGFVSDLQHTLSGKTRVFGGGESTVRVQTVSGNLTIG